MPLYDYTCPYCGSEFESSSSVADRQYAECRSCYGTAVKEIRCAPRLSSAMGLSQDFPSMAAKWRKAAERRGRGEDMTAANRGVADEGILRDAHAQRAVLGKNKIIVG